MKGSLKKYAIIELEFESTNDFRFALNEISNSVSRGTIHDRKKFGECMAQLTVSILSEPDFRIEEINGKQCMIFKSKMDENGK